MRGSRILSSRWSALIHPRGQHSTLYYTLPVGLSSLNPFILSCTTMFSPSTNCRAMFWPSILLHRLFSQLILSGSTLRPSPSGDLNPNAGTSIGSPVRLILPVLTITVLTSFVDVEEFVVAKVLSALINLCELGLFQKMRIWEPVSTLWDLSIFIYHPNIWIRQGGRERVWLIFMSNC